ncbi:transcription initiation factor IIB [Halopelagius longus]|uniref:Transcription initiation factor IIB n=1 Tax=Halopelagius longus TaxID=1236180 RepID=A0A1H1E7Z6_9EURY|nr:transcription initiation factor IIB family protein [Halopelagius longus]RDI71643.1 transcription initiation factor IIB family protein [Halopelagius longus]SDQ84803.1 Transcription initiation factor IIB (TFIIB) [Halopelagius longus]
MSKAHSTQTESAQADQTQTDETQAGDAARTEDESERARDGEARTCPECGGRLRAEDGETVCAGCGLVVSEYRIDHGPEWRSFADDDRNPKRTGAPLTRSRHDKGLSTEIGRSTRVKGRKRRRLARMRRQHNRARISTKRERNQVYAFTEIRRLTGALSLPDRIRDHACSLFTSAQNEDLLRGRSLEGFAAACVYAACRVAGVSRTTDEVTEAAKATADEQSAAYDALNRELGLPVGPIDPAEYIPRFASELDLSGEVERRAREYAAEASERGLSVGRNPSGVAAACLYTAARDADADLTQTEAADVAGVTPVTLRSTYTDLRDDGDE